MPKTRELTASVVLCTYNGERYIQQQLDSLLAQSRLPEQIVAVDDGSADRTWEILQAFAEKARGRGFSVDAQRNPDNLGYVRNFEAAFQRAGTDMIFVCDQDDVWDPEKLAIMHERFTGDPDLLLLHSDARLVDARLGDLGCSLFDALELGPDELQRVHDGRGFDVLLRRNIVTGATMAFRRDLLALAVPFGDGWIQDEWLAIIASAIGKIDVVERKLIDYRQHDANQLGMRRRTLDVKVREIGLSRAQLLRNDAKRMESLLQRLKQLPAAVEKHMPACVQDKLEHTRVRMHITDIARIKRISPILKEAASGRYRRYGAGIRSVLRDLLRGG
ncbi:MAG: glycosyltransferase family 2 protein [Syntrophus sp. (in: bacteria)]|nr:glycosyltransferase family 2 protein [Syntrophus sp. (in: bacteria)]